MSTTTKIAIVGGGIGGLTLALALSKTAAMSRLKIDLYESTSSLEAQVGAGIGIWPRAWQVFEQLGLDQELLKYADSQPTNGPVQTFTYRVSDRRNGFNFYTLCTTSGSHIAFHRGCLQSFLLSQIPSSVTIHTSKRLSHIRESPDGQKELAFTDSGIDKADLVIGADGLQSATRRCLVEKLGASYMSHDCHHPADPIWSGTIAYRALIPRQKLVDAGLANHPSLCHGLQYLGQSGFVIAYPISGGSLINFVGFVIRHDLEGKEFNPGTDAPMPPTPEMDDVDPWSENSGPCHRRWVARVHPDEVKKAFEGWEDLVLELIEHIESPLRWAVHVAPSLDVFAHDQIVLIGDAAHAMHPHQGSGAGQAIEDAYVLALLISTAISATPPSSKLDISSINKVTQSYNSTRVRACRLAALRSRANGYHFTFRTRIAGTSDDWRVVDQENPEELENLGARIRDEWKWVWERDVLLQEVETAIGGLQSIL